VQCIEGAVHCRVGTESALDGVWGWCGGPGSHMLQCAAAVMMLMIEGDATVEM
jgi:hypothetical protein